MPGLGKKTFTAGDVLIAGDVNNYLMDQTVMNFATTAARSSAIPVPSTGMVSYVGDTGSETPASTIPQIQAYTGAAWQNLDGMTLLATGVLNSTAGVTIDNVFTSAHRNYKISLALTNAASSVGVAIVMRSGGVNNNTANYWQAGNANSLASGPTRTGGINNGSWGVGAIYTGGATTLNVDMTLYNPQRADITVMQFLGTNFRPAAEYIENKMESGLFNLQTVFDGFSIVPTAAFSITGTVQVYGMRSA